MDKWPRVLVMTIAFICAVYAFLAMLGGDLTSAPESGVGKIYKGENLNDVHSIMQNKNGDIYTLGYTCVQKFNKSGEFIGGAYYDSNSTKQVSDNEFLSLNEGKVVVLNCGDNVIYFFDENFDVVEKIEVEQPYNDSDFYSDYPNTDATDKEVKLSFFSNTASSGDEKIKLDAPRNRLFSRDFGFLFLLISILAMGPKLFGKQDEED